MTDDDRCIGLASIVSFKLNKILKLMNAINHIKTKLHKTLVLPILLYGSEYKEKKNFIS